jgi:hypothetical protein
MCEVSRFKKVIPSFIHRCPTTFSECELTRKNISNPRPNVVMHPEVTVRGKRHFGGSQSELTVKLGEVTEDNLVEFDLRRDARRSTLSWAAT